MSFQWGPKPLADQEQGCHIWSSTQGGIVSGTMQLRAIHVHCNNGHIGLFANMINLPSKPQKVSNITIISQKSAK